MNRRDFFKGLAVACMAASAGIELLPEQRELVARHRSVYDLQHDRFVHRFDVVVDGSQYCVDAFSAKKALTEDEARLMLDALERHIGNVEVVPA